MAHIPMKKTGTQPNIPKVVMDRGWIVHGFRITNVDDKGNWDGITKCGKRVSKTSGAVKVFNRKISCKSCMRRLGIKRRETHPLASQDDFIILVIPSASYVYKKIKTRYGFRNESCKNKQKSHILWKVKPDFDVNSSNGYAQLRDQYITLCGKTLHPKTEYQKENRYSLGVIPTDTGVCSNCLKELSEEDLALVEPYLP